MEDNNQIHQEEVNFIRKVEGHIEANLNNDQFGVEQLANEMGISRTHLYRKLQKSSGKSISRFIREFRLQRAREMLIAEDTTASEVSYAVGFSSPSYFNKCFTEYYGYSPGKAKIIAETSSEAAKVINRPSSQIRNSKLVWVGFLMIVILAGVLLYSLAGKEENPVTDRSVIVLPFNSLSPNQENQYLAQGMVEAISRHLSDIKELRVKSTTAVAQFQDQDMSLQQIGAALNVSNMVQGSIQRQNDTIRIEIKLIDAKDETQLWAKNYDRKFSDLLKIQSDIAENVALALKANLSPDERSLIDMRTSYDPQAYDNFLKGKSYSMSDKSIGYFETAIALDSTMPLGYLGMGAQYWIKAASYVTQFSALEACELAQPYLDKAFQLDPKLMEVNGWRAFSKLYCNWDFAGAEERFKIGIKSDDHLFLFMYTNFLLFENRHEEAFSAALQLRKDDPYFPLTSIILAYYFTERYDEGREYIAARLSTYVDFNTLFTSGYFMLNTGEYDQALELFLKALDGSWGKRPPKVLGMIGATYAQQGDRAQALQLLEEIKAAKLETDAGSPAFYISIIYSALGEKQEALKWLKTAIEDHEFDVLWLVSEPQLYSLHDEPAFAALVKQVGFRSHAYPIGLPIELL